MHYEVLTGAVWGGKVFRFGFGVSRGVVYTCWLTQHKYTHVVFGVQLCSLVCALFCCALVVLWWLLRLWLPSVVLIMLCVGTLLPCVVEVGR